MIRKRWNEIDCMYVMGAFLVILGHSHSSDWKTIISTPYYPIVNAIYLFHMPLYFFISGFLFINSGIPDRESFAPWIRRKAERLLIPYFFLTSISLFPKYCLEHQGIKDLTLKYILKVILAPRAGVWGHLWFLPTLFIIYFVFGWILVVFGRNKRSCVYGLLILSLVVYYMPLETEWLSISDFKNYTVYFWTGGIFNRWVSDHSLDGNRHTKILQTVVLVILAAGIRIIWADSRTGRLLCALLLIGSCWLLAALVHWKHAEVIAFNNLTIYLYSWPGQAAAMMICDRMKTPWYMTMILMFAAGIFVPGIIIQLYRRTLIKRYPLLDLALGMR